jgi:ribonuclease P protein component
MLAKKHRITKKKDFDKIFKSGKGKKEGFFVLKFIKNNLPESRFAFVVSLKVSKKAVVRNKIRRTLSEIIRQNMDGIKKGYDFIFVVQPGIAQNWEEIKKTVLKCLNQ